MRTKLTTYDESLDMCVCVVNALHVCVCVCVISVIGLNMIFTLECTVFVDLIKIYARFIPSFCSLFSPILFLFFICFRISIYISFLLVLLVVKF